MKKITYLLSTLLIALLFIPIVFAKDEVSIESYELVKSSDTTTELNKPTIDGLNIAFDLSFGKVDDFARYKIVINNPTVKDYEIIKDLDFNTSEYITYTYEFENNNNIVKSNSKTTMNITITYSKVVPPEKLSNGKFVENNKMAISLASETSSISKEINPNTSSSSILIICVLGLSISLLSLILFGRTKKKKYITTFMLSLLLIPTTIFALEKLQINVETKITINEEQSEKYAFKHIIRTAIKESEKANYHIEEEYIYDDAPTYIINGERYAIYYISEETQYSSGERVKVNGVDYLKINVRKYDNNGLPIELCTHDEATNEYICPEESLEEATYYGAEYFKEENITYDNEEFEKMNFSNDINTNGWEDDGYADVYLPTRFTMPEHNVSFISGTIRK